MTMQMVRGLTSLNTKKRTAKKKPGWKQAEAEHQKFLNSLGITDKKKTAKGEKYEAMAKTQSYERNPKVVKTSDTIPTGPTARRDGRNRYTGTEIVGIATMHKSNAVPIRRGTKEAIEIAQMAK